MYPPEHRARCYDPAIDRFISEDPIGLRGGGPNLYQYAYDDPTNFLDPLGLKPPAPPPPCGSLGANCQPPNNCPPLPSHPDWANPSDDIRSLQDGWNDSVPIQLAAGPLGWALTPITGSVALAGVGLAVEGGHYGVTHRFFNPLNPFGPPIGKRSPWLPPSGPGGCQ